MYALAQIHIHAYTVHKDCTYVHICTHTSTCKYVCNHTYTHTRIPCQIVITACFQTLESKVCITCTCIALLQLLASDIIWTHDSHYSQTHTHTKIIIIFLRMHTHKHTHLLVNKHESTHTHRHTHLLVNNHTHTHTNTHTNIQQTSLISDISANDTQQSQHE
jgi:hypothetical protein